MKKWLVTASIIVVASSALCLPVRAEPKNERVPSAPSVEAWWIDIGGRRAFGTVPDVKLGEMKDGLLDPATMSLATMSLVTPAGALHDPALFSPRSIAYAFDGVWADDLTDVVKNDPRPVGFQGPIGGAPLVAQGE